LRAGVFLDGAAFLAGEPFFRLGAALRAARPGGAAFPGFRADPFRDTAFPELDAAALAEAAFFGAAFLAGFAARAALRLAICGLL
jgi:hypothetical protein